MKFWYRVCFVLVRVGLFFWHPVLRVQGLENLTKGAATTAAPPIRSGSFWRFASRSFSASWRKASCGARRSSDGSWRNSV